MFLNVLLTVAVLLLSKKVDRAVDSKGIQIYILEETRKITTMSERSQVVSRRVTYQQLEGLWEALNNHRELALGFNKTAQARDASRRMWEEIALSLNSQGDGAVKDWKGWSKYWNDYKSKLKKLSAATTTSHRQTGGGPSSVKPMSEIEKRFLLILGDNFGLGLVGARVQPFAEYQAETELAQGGSQSILSGLVVPLSLSTDAGPSRTPPNITQTAPPTPPPLTSEPPRTPLGGFQTSVTTPHRRRNQTLSPRRRRLRQEPMSAAAARKLIIEVSRRRAELDEQQILLMSELINELKEIKNILRSTGHPTSG